MVFKMVPKMGFKVANSVTDDCELLLRHGLHVDFRHGNDHVN